MLVAVVVMMLFRTLDHRNHASMRDFAHHVLKLNRGVVDAEIVDQSLLYVP